MNLKNLKIGRKLMLGFGALILIAGILGSIAVYNMNRVADKSNILANEFIPEVEISNQLERSSLQTMYNMRGYALSEEEKYLNAATSYLSEVKKYLTEARDLSENATQLKKLGDAIDVTMESVKSYEGFAQQTEKVNQVLAVDRVKMDEAAQKYMQNCADYLDFQNEAMAKEIATKSTTEERLSKITLINDIIDIGNAIRVGNFKSQATRDPDVFKDALSHFDLMDKKFKEIREITRINVNIQQLNNIEAAATSYRNAMDSFLENWLAREELSKQRGEAGDMVVEQAKEVAEAGIEHTSTIAMEASTLLKSSSLTMIIGLIIALVIGVVFAVAISKAITVPIGKGVKFAKQIADGDLTAKIDVNQKDEVGQLTKALSDMSNKLSGIIVDILAGSDNISSASVQMSASAQEMSQGASEQASSAEEVSSSMEEMASNIEQNNDNAQQTEKIAVSAAQGIAAGSQAVDQAVSSMKTIAEKIKIINDIAFQTNILALNAAVEAARAGEHGKGFAVVAAEVRKLAERSKIAADEIDGLSQSGVSVSESAGKQLSEIVPEIEKTAKLVQEIAAASLEQSAGASQVNNAIQQLNQVTQQNAAVSEEMATSSEELSSQAEQLKELVSYFNVGESHAKSGLYTSNVKQAKKKVNLKHVVKESKTVSEKSDDNVELNLENSVKKTEDEYENF